MIRAQLRIRLPASLWIATVSRAHPDATFKLLAGYRAEGRAVELGEIFADDPVPIADSLREHEAIAHIELLGADDGRVLARYETTETALYEFVERSSLPIEFPVLARDGWFDLDLTGTRADLDDLRTQLEASGGSYELQSVVSTHSTDALLTDRQREVLRAAIRAGYFEVPRECTLAELAKTVDVDKSTASTVLRRGEATLLKWFLMGPDADGSALNSRVTR